MDVLSLDITVAQWLHLLVAAELNSAASGCKLVEKEVLCAINELKIFLEHCARRTMSEWGRYLMRQLGLEGTVKLSASLVMPLSSNS